VLEQQLAIGHAIVLGVVRFRIDIRHLVGQHVAGAVLDDDALDQRMRQRRVDA
jgi:hypothetical protein